MITFPRVDAIEYTFSGDALQVRREQLRERAEGKLNTQDQRQVEQMKQTDREVRQHEQMHVSVGGSLITSGPTYAFDTGPDGKRYAVSGEVGIDTSPAKTPEETIPKAQHIRRTALAPPDPSPQDRRVAATASRMEQQARVDLADQLRKESAETAAEPDRGKEQAADFYASVARFDGAERRERFSAVA